MKLFRSDSLFRCFVTGALGALAFLPAATASATPGTITLSGGEVLAGDITEVVNGDHITLRLPGGQIRIVTWAQIGGFQISGGASVTVSAGTPAPTPPPTYTAPPPAYGTPTYTPAPAPPPPAYGSPPPAYGYGSPPPAYAAPPPPPRHWYQQGPVIGGRLTTSYLSGSLDKRNGGNAQITDFVGFGGGAEIDFGWRWSPKLQGYLGVELTGYSTGPTNVNYTNYDTPWGAWVGLGLQGNTNPRGLGFYWDIATGLRVLHVGYTDINGNAQSANYSGWEMLRVGLGLSLRADHVDINVAPWASVGMFSSVSDANCDAAYGGSFCKDPSYVTTFHTGYGLAVTGNLDLF
jgi:hypothetical protein